MYFKDYINYLLQVGDSLPEINTKAYGDSAEIMNIENMMVNYPLLWIESPDIDISGDQDSFKYMYNGAFVVLINSSTNTIDEKKDNIDQIHRIISKYLKALLDDGVLDIAFHRIRMEVIMSALSDNSQAIRVEFQSKSAVASLCLDDL